MKIWVYYRDFAPPGAIDPGGISKALHGLVSGLAARSADVTVLCESASAADTAPPNGYTVRAFARRPRSWWWRLSPTLRDFVTESAAPDFVLLNGVFTPNVAALARLLRRRGIPYLMAPHDPYSPALFARRRYTKELYWRFIERPLVAQAIAVQVLCLRHAEWLRARGVHTPVIEIANGVDPSEVPPDSPRAQGEGPPSALFLGRIDSFNKGLDLLVDAVGELNGRIRLTLQGPDWGDEDDLVKQAAVRRTDVTFLPPDYSVTAPELISRHDLLCLTSRFEGFGLAPLDAMLAARVVLVSEEAGIAQHVLRGGCGVVVTPDAAGVRRGLEELLALRSKWADMGRAGRDYALEHLRWDNIAARALDEYALILLAKRP